MQVRVLRCRNGIVCGQVRLRLKYQHALLLLRGFLYDSNPSH